MLLDRLTRSLSKVAGSKQVLRALKEGTLATVYIARDADPFVTRPVADACEKAGLRVVEVDDMAALGRAAGLTVKTAAAGILKGS
jgi:large subunit ribosomal protein L7A